MNLMFLLPISTLVVSLASAALQTSKQKLFSCDCTTYKGVVYNKDKLLGEIIGRQAATFESCGNQCLMYPACKAISYVASAQICYFHGSGLTNANPNKSLYTVYPDAVHSVITCPTRKPSSPVLCGKQANAYKAIINKNTRIIGGTEANPHSWPWLCYMVTDFGNGMGSACGSSLLRIKNGVEKSDIVLTAAHCVTNRTTIGTKPVAYQPSQISVYTGDHNNEQYDDGEEPRKAIRIAFHKDFLFTQELGAINDIALVKLATPVSFTDTIRPICLPQAKEAIPTGKTCMAAGWGRTSSTNEDELPTNLQQVLAPAQDGQTCTAGWGTIYNETIHICAGDMGGTSGICNGDSGGMLSCQQTDLSWKLYGATSFTVAGTCLQAGMPSIFTRVSNYIDWINKNMNEMTSVK